MTQGELMERSGPLLSEAELQALMQGVEDGSIDTSVGEPPGDRVMSYNLAAEDSATHGQLAAVAMVDERFSRQLRSSLLTLLRQAVKVSHTPFEISSFSEYIMSVPSPCNVNIIRISPLTGYGLITIEPSLVYGAVDSFFGGRGEGFGDAPPGKGFTPTEERVIQLMLDAMYRDLRDAWQPVYNLKFEYVSSEMNPLFAQVAEERENVIVTRLQVEIGSGVRGTITIMYPFSSLKPIRLLLRGRVQSGERDERMAAAWSDQLRDAVLDASLPITGVLGTAQTSFGELMKMAPGDMIWLRPSEHIRVNVAANPAFEASYGEANGQVALRIERTLPPPGSQTTNVPAPAGNTKAETSK
jgi:flagellar motor switch protein FliM